MEFVAIVFTVLALASAWVIFRLDRSAARRREIGGARAVLLAVQRGIVEGMPTLGYSYAGWGELYFTNVYDVPASLEQGQEARRLVEQGSHYQVFEVPTAPLELLATSASAGDLISEETVFVANVALWRLRVFNQLVEKQTAFNAFHAAEITDEGLSEDRRRAISHAAEQLNIGLHLDGIGQAGTDDGWYGRLRAAVASDVARLGDIERLGWWRRRDERSLVVGDILVTVLCGAALVLATVAALTG